MILLYKNIDFYYTQTKQSINLLVKFIYFLNFKIIQFISRSAKQRFQNPIK